MPAKPPVSVAHPWGLEGTHCNNVAPRTAGLRDQHRILVDTDQRRLALDADPHDCTEFGGDLEKQRLDFVLVSERGLQQVGLPSQRVESRVESGQTLRETARLSSVPSLGRAMRDVRWFDNPWLLSPPSPLPAFLFLFLGCPLCCSCPEVLLDRLLDLRCSRPLLQRFLINCLFDAASEVAMISQPIPDPLERLDYRRVL
jgi:hypothetical protein